MGVKARAAVFIFDGERVLLMRRIKPGREYYLVPGGGIEAGETPEEAAVREIKEETSLDVELTGELAKSEASGRTVHYFLASEYRGKPRLGGPELARQSGDNLYALEWIEPGKLEEIDLQPTEDLDLVLGLFSEARRRSGDAEQRPVGSFDTLGPSYTRHMSDAAKPHELLSVEEYLALEESATVRHEYVGGVIHAMTSATRRHNRIAGNIYAALGLAARNGPCRVYMETVKLRTADDVFYYPDVMVACGEEPDDAYVEHDPCLVVEVVSRSTEQTDRREKLLAYRKLPNLRMYLIVDQDRHVVERHWRDDEGKWWQALQSGEGSFDVPCPGTRLSLGDIYEGVRETP